MEESVSKKQPSPNDQRSLVKNPNSAAYQADRANRAQQAQQAQQAKQSSKKK